MCVMIAHETTYSYMFQQFLFWVFTLEKRNCTQVYIITLFVIVKAWRQLKCPSLGECISCSFIQRKQLSNEEQTIDTSNTWTDIKGIGWVQDAGLKTLNIRGFKLYDILEKTKPQSRRNRCMITKGKGWGRVWKTKELREEFGGSVMKLSSVLTDHT
jgi:hypothetical protein